MDLSDTVSPAMKQIILLNELFSTAKKKLIQRTPGLYPASRHASSNRLREQLLNGGTNIKDRMNKRMLFIINRMKIQIY